MKSFTRFLAALAILIVAGAAAPAYADHSWGNYHWARTANPFTLKLGDATTPTWDPYLVEAKNDWSASSVLDLTIVPSIANPKTCKATTGRVEVCNAKYGANGWLGLASIWADGSGHITKGTAKLNDTYYSTATYNTSAWRRLVMCQEIAHAFGLDHQDEAFNNANLGTCMDYTNSPAGNEHPNAHDFEQLETIYAHLDGYTTVSALAAQVKGLALGLVVEDEADFGHPVKYDKQGRANVFAKELKNGETKITHVFWLPEHADEHEH